MKKIFALYISYTLLISVFVPILLGLAISDHGPSFEQSVNDSYSSNIISVLNPETKELKTSEFENYIIGVVAAEVPANFETEALKAQAVAARTYALRKILQNNLSEIDTADMGQAYNTIDDMKAKWGTNFDKYYDKIQSAVLSTEGEILVYDNEPILAVFHSTSSGKTESAENVWGSSVDYLVSVDSVGDTQAPDYTYEEYFTKEDLVGRLQAAYPDLIFTDAPILQQIQIAERTDAGYVKYVQTGNRLLSGKEFREALGLRSSDFTLSESDGMITVTTKGYGHGAGMSQYGAEYMAQQGSTYKEILSHYYPGTTLTLQSNLSA